MEFDNNKPIYIQVAEDISTKILSGQFEPDGRIPSVREWGAAIGVNPNTIARSYELLTTDGVIYNKRGLGFFVCADAREKLDSIARKKFIETEIPAFLAKAAVLGIDLKEYVK